MGLLTHVVSEDDLGSTVNELIEKLFNRPIRAYGGIKSLLVDTFDCGIETQMELESCAISKAGSGPEAQEGMAAFLEKRKPNFKEAVM